MKKTIILILGCQESTDPFFYKEYKECILETWAKDLPENIQTIYYQGGSETKFENNILTLECEDDLKWTYKKTYLALQYIYKNFDFDLILRTNTSTYINTYLLNLFIENIYDESKYYGADLYSLSEACAPYPLSIYRRGNGILYDKKDVENILYNGICLLYKGICDDIGLDDILNSYQIQESLKNNYKYIDNHAGWPHSWYKCIDKVFDTNHQISNYNNSTNYDISITTTLKKYREREEEFKIYHEYHNLILNLKYRPEVEIIKSIRDYSENPDIFLGSVIGYIDYNRWKRFDKNVLYLMEISNKASDDEQFSIYREIQGRFLDFKNNNRISYL